MTVQFVLDRSFHPWNLTCIGCAYGFWVHVSSDSAADTYARLHADVAHHCDQWSIGVRTRGHG